MEQPIEPLLLKFENKDALERFFKILSDAAFDGRGIVICQGKCYGYAPELLDALKTMVGAFDTPIARRRDDSDFANEARKIAREAIEKATVPFVCGVQS